MQIRGYKINKWDNHDNYFRDYILNNPMGSSIGKIYPEHNDEYLTICYFNLKEKYIRGQKDFTQDVWDKLNGFYQSKNK